MSKLLDDAIKEWGESNGFRKVKGRKGRNIDGGGYSKPAAARQPVNKARLLKTINKAPEVMVKISGGGKDMGSIKAHLDYISRNGDVELENERGEKLKGKDDVRFVRDQWKSQAIPYENGKRKEAFNIILSMPPNTDRAAVKNAARDFAKQTFEGHQYVFAAHDDEKHPHVHLTVKATSINGVRLNPRKADLQHWRETFADKLQDYGIEANATPRQARGVVHKQEKQAIIHIQKDYQKGKRKEPAIRIEQRKAVIKKELTQKQAHPNPHNNKISAARKRTIGSYRKVAEAMAVGGEKADVLKIAAFVQGMPPVQTRHEKAVANLRQKIAIEKQGGIVEKAAEKKTQIHNQKDATQGKTTRKTTYPDKGNER